MNVKALLTVVIFMASLCFMVIQDAEAARLGGGRSFGSRPSMQRSTTAPMQQKAPMANAVPAAAAQKSGMLGGMGGMFGGLLAGTLLGSLLFGGPFNGGGFMDILLIALVAFLAFKLFARFRANNAPSAAGAGGGAMRYQAQPQSQGYTQGGSAWDKLRASAPQSAAASPSVPAGFDTDDFLRGAKMAYTRLQSAWDKRDIADIAQFSSPAVLQEIQQQLAEDPNPGHTEILLVNAQLLSVQNEGSSQTASVYFDVLMREEAGRDTTQAREVWHFVRPVDGSDSWKLDGIQQVD